MYDKEGISKEIEESNIKVPLTFEIFGEVDGKQAQFDRFSNCTLTVILEGDIILL